MMYIERKIAARFSNPRSGGDVCDVAATFHANLGDADALAVLAWSVALNEGVTLEVLLERIQAAATEFFVAPLEPDAKSVGGRPAKNWRAVYGENRTQLELGAIVRKSADEKLSLTAARRAALVAARASAGLGRLPTATISKDVEALKQTSR